MSTTYVPLALDDGGANEVVGAADEVVVDVPAERLGAAFGFCTVSSGFANGANEAVGALGSSLSFGVGAANGAKDAAGAL